MFCCPSACCGVVYSNARFKISFVLGKTKNNNSFGQKCHCLFTMRDFLYICPYLSLQINLSGKKRFVVSACQIHSAFQSTSIKASNSSNKLVTFAGYLFLSSFLGGSRDKISIRAILLREEGGRDEENVCRLSSIGFHSDSFAVSGSAGGGAECCR